METRYSPAHIWVRFLSDGAAQLGLTAPFVGAMRGSAWIDLCDEGDVLREGDWMGDVEFFKGVYDLYAPIGGTVTHVNDAVLRTPRLLDGETWLLELHDCTTGGALLDEAAYLQMISGGVR